MDTIFNFTRTFSLLVILPVTLTLSFSDYCKGNGDSLSHDFFPLNVGNEFFYRREAWFIPGGSWTELATITVTHDSIFQGKKYYWVYGLSLFEGWYRVDTVTGSLYMYDTLSNCENYDHYKLRDSLKAELNQYINYCTVGTPVQCHLRSTAGLLFGIQTDVIGFRSISGTHSRRYTSKFGLYTYDYSVYLGGGMAYGASSVMIGCRIDGVAYGDSTLTNIRSGELIDANSSILKQNFPNPFNPSTEIRFETSVGGHAGLKVYDNTGKQISVLVNEYLPAGSHVRIFDASPLPSGVYYYTLELNGSKATRKMALIK